MATTQPQPAVPAAHVICTGNVQTPTAANAFVWQCIKGEHLGMLLLTESCHDHELITSPNLQYITACMQYNNNTEDMWNIAINVVSRRINTLKHVSRTEAMKEKLIRLQG